MCVYVCAHTPMLVEQVRETFNAWRNDILNLESGFISVSSEGAISVPYDVGPFTFSLGMLLI